MNKGAIVLIVIAVVLVLATLFFSCVPAGKAMWNNWFFEVQKADDATNYATRKKVEDTARSMLATYEADKMIYEQYKDSEDSDEKDIRVLYVPQQERPLCRAGKDGKVWQFNFGKSILNKFFKYDVQNESEWARAYSKEYHIDMKRVFINKDTTVADVSGSFDVTTYKAWLSQDTWQWKDNAKGYRLIYFAEPQIETAHGNIVKRQAAYQFRFVSADAGTLRVTVEND